MCVALRDKWDIGSKISRPCDGGLVWRDRRYIAMAVGKSTKYKIQYTENIAMAVGWINKIHNIWPGRWGVSLIHVMSKLNRSHSRRYGWSVTLMIMQMLIYCFANVPIKETKVSLRKSLFSNSANSFITKFIQMCSSRTNIAIQRTSTFLPSPRVWYCI